MFTYVRHRVGYFNSIELVTRLINDKLNRSIFFFFSPPSLYARETRFYRRCNIDEIFKRDKQHPLRLSTLWTGFVQVEKFKRKLDISDGARVKCSHPFPLYAFVISVTVYSFLRFCVRSRCNARSRCYHRADFSFTTRVLLFTPSAGDKGNLSFRCFWNFYPRTQNVT